MHLDRWQATPYYTKSSAENYLGEQASRAAHVSAPHHDPNALRRGTTATAVCCTQGVGTLANVGIRGVLGHEHRRVHNHDILTSSLAMATVVVPRLLAHVTGGGPFA